MSVKARVRRELVRVPGAMPVARMTVETIRVCLKYRVTGLASEAGFFMLLSLPPLVLGLFGGVGYLGKWLGDDTVTRIIAQIQTWAGQFLTPGLIQNTLLPTVQDVFKDGRFDLISVGFLLSVWSGSRALNVFVDTISIMYGQSGVRGIVRTRALSLTLYVLSLVVGIVVIPLVVIGPTWLKDLLPKETGFLAWLYWPVVTVLAVASIATLFHISTPRRSPWLRDVPGAVLTLVLWSLSSYVLRGTVAASLKGGTSIYGPLSAPIVLLIFLYALAIAVLIGAALNAAIRTLWPVEERLSLRARVVEWVQGKLASRRAGSAAPAPGGARAGTASVASATRTPADTAHGAPAGNGAVASGGVAGLLAAQADATAEEELVGSLAGLREEARKPLTPVPDDSDDTQFGEEAPDPISFLRTRSG
ncbi:MULTISPECIES: YihY/virulence factor BrkB family protein [unclassified Phycicoccus]|uniref:YihY/virulence factor BrkB family protein n=1 Tax=unclassified Phycicoccus TaxID=2637926 RepID=UPI001F182134|nr:MULTISPECIES: YihY/virulence factor BrkB family protein [unclassified Phycicoccus]